MLAPLDRALTVRQPWASLIAAGRKVIEVRTWRTDHRGPIVIHAASAATGCAACERKGWTLDVSGGVLRCDACSPLSDDDAAILAGWSRGEAPERGILSCVVDLEDVRPMTPGDLGAACLADRVDVRGSFAWVLSGARAVEPRKVAGKLSLWHLAPALDAVALSPEGIPVAVSRATVDAWGDDLSSTDRDRVRAGAVVGTADGWSVR